MYTTSRSQLGWADLAQHSTFRPEWRTMYTRDGEARRLLDFVSGAMRYTVDAQGRVDLHLQPPGEVYHILACGRDAEIMLENAIADASALALGYDCWRPSTSTYPRTAR